MKEILDLKVGDVVRVMREDKCISISIVDKVLPNKRFKLLNTSFYWRANGTRNTHTVKSHRNDYVIKGDYSACQQAYRRGLQERFLIATDQIIDGECVRTTEGLVLLNKIMDSFGFDTVSYLKLIEKELKMF